MRLIKPSFNSNWKYILGEVFLIFIGISLAIWFNNWNASQRLKQDKEAVMVKIKEEIKSNFNELSEARKKNRLILLAYTDYQKIYNNTTSEIISTPVHISALQNKYPGFFRITDSIKVSSDLYHYRGGTHIELEMPVLTEIAWETARFISITNEFDFECLYELERMYHLQRGVQDEINKAANALQKRELKELMNILDFLNQLDLQLDENYKEMLRNIENCT